MRDIFRAPLSLDEVRQLAALASADAMFSWRSPSAKPYRDRRGSISEGELIRLMASEPRLVRRPILVKGGRIVFGFKPSEYEAALGGRRRSRRKR